MYATQQHCRLTPFYAVASPSQLQVNQESIRCLNCILAEYLPEFQLPTTLTVTTVDRLIDGQKSVQIRAKA